LYLEIPHVNTFVTTTRNKTIAIREPSTWSEAAVGFTESMFALASGSVPQFHTLFIPTCQKHGVIRAPGNKWHWLLVAC
jgi:hypothetical protein